MMRYSTEEIIWLSKFLVCATVYAVCTHWAGSSKYSMPHADMELHKKLTFD